MISLNFNGLAVSINLGGDNERIGHDAGFFGDVAMAWQLEPGDLRSSLSCCLGSKRKTEGKEREKRQRHKDFLPRRLFDKAGT